MTEKTKKGPEILDVDDDWDGNDNEVELDAKEKKYCCDAEKRRRIERLKEERELQRELREFFDD